MQLPSTLLKAAYTLPLLGLMLLTSCSRHSENTGGKALSIDSMPVQKFVIAADKDTTLACNERIIIRIRKNTFTNKTGKPVTGAVDIKIKQALSRKDILASGLTTTSDGKLLETGGMVYIDASSNGEPLEIAKDKAIGMIVPSKNIRKDMQVFEGVADSNGINWKNPRPVLNNRLSPRDSFSEARANMRREEVDVIVEHVTDTKAESDRRASGGATIEQQNFDAIRTDASGRKFITDKNWNEIAVARESTDPSGKKRYFDKAGKEIVPDAHRDPLLSQNDNDTSVVEVGRKVSYNKNGTPGTIEKLKSERMQTDINLTGNPDDDFIRELPEIKGINMPQADPNTNYIFTIRKLGWVNIDALCFDKRTREVELITTINNKKEFGKIYLSLVVLNKNIYISGYEKNDGSYGFSHGDFETTKLPVGETAAIVITSIKDGKPYYAIQKFTIWDKQSYKLNLKETTGEKLKIALEKEI